MNVLLKEDRREIYDVHIFPPIFTRTNNDSGTNNEIIKSKSRVNRSTKDTSLHRESSGNNRVPILIAGRVPVRLVNYRYT